VATYTERVQTMLSKKQFREITKLSRRTEQPISVLLREALNKTYFHTVSLEQRRMAAKRLASLQAPVSDWDQMEEEIEAGIRQP